jgi:hypothetical protein
MEPSITSAADSMTFFTPAMALWFTSFSLLVFLLRFGTAHLVAQFQSFQENRSSKPGCYHILIFFRQINMRSRQLALQANYYSANQAHAPQ